jgi:hypothetical protein
MERIKIFIFLKKAVTVFKKMLRFLFHQSLDKKSAATDTIGFKT